MKAKNIFVILMFFIVLFSISSVSAEEILETNDVSALSVDDAVEVMSVSESSQDWDDLKADVENENVSEIIYSGADVVPTSQITFNHDLTIVGASGSSIGNANSDNITSYSFTPFISNSNVNINIVNMTFKNMNNEILFQLGGNGNYVFENCIFENVNATGGKKSVIWFELGTGLVDNCTFSNCTTQYGTISNFHEGDVNAVHLTVKDSTFNNNFGGTSSGAINNCGQMTIVNSTFNHNRAGWWAGAVHTHIGANTTIRKSKFIDNVAGWNGGALYTYSTLTLIDSDFIGNNCTTNTGGGAIGSLAYWGQTAPTMTVINCNFTNNLNDNGAGNGGAIAFSGGTLNVYNSYFEHNDAKKGTAIYASGLTNSNIVNNTFINNTGIKNGVDTLVLSGSYNLENNSYSDDTPMTIDVVLKAEFTFGNGVDCNIRTTSIYSDYIKTAAYEVFVDGESYLNTTGNEFSVVVNDNNKHVVYVVLKGRNNVSNNVTVPLDAIYVSTSGSDSGNGSASNPFNNIYDAIDAVNNDVYTIIVEEGTYYLSSSKRVSNNLNIIGLGNVVFDGILSNSNLFSLRTFDYSFKNITFANFNKRIIYPFSSSYSPVVELINCTFIENDISDYMIHAYSISAENSKFINNTVSNGIFNFNKAGSTLNCVDSTFINNVASGNGAVFNGNIFTSANFIGCLFVDNSANNGAVIYITPSSVNVNVNDCVFLNNVASGDGNVITSNSPVVANNNWWGNTEYDYTIAPNVSSSVMVNNWLFLDETHNFVSDGIEHISLNLNNYNSASNIISNYDGSCLPDVDMNISVNNDATSVSEITLKEGSASFNVYNLTINNYTVLVNYYDNEYSFDFSFNGNKLYPYLTVRVKDMIVGGNATIVINMPASVTGNVIITVNGVNTTVPIVNGLVSTQIPTLNNLQEIVYNILVTFEGNNNYYGVSNSTFFMLCDDGSQWPMATYDSKNTGKVPYYGVTDLNNVKWDVEIGGNISNIVVDADGNVYVSNGSVIYSFNDEGVLLWDYSVIGYSNFTGLAISHDVIIATREGYGIYFIDRFTGKDYSTANIWQGSSLFAPTVDEKGTIYISGEYQNDTGGYIVTIIPYSTWMFGDDIIVVDIGNHSPIGSPVCTYDGIVWVNTVDGLILVNDEGYVGDYLLGYDSCGFPVKSSNHDIVYDLFDGYLRLFDPIGSSLGGKPCNGHYIVLDEDNNKIYVVGDYNITTFDILDVYDLSNQYTVHTNYNYTSILIDANGNIYGITDSNMLCSIDMSYDYIDDTLGFNIYGPLVMNSDGEILACDEYGVLYCFENENYLSSPFSCDEPLLGISLSEINEMDIVQNSLLSISSDNILSDSIIDDSLNEYSWTYLKNYIIPFVSYDTYIYELTDDEDLYFDEYQMNPDADYPTKEKVGESIEIVLPKGHYIADDKSDYLIFPSVADTYSWNEHEEWWELDHDSTISVTYNGNNSIIDAGNIKYYFMGPYHVAADGNLGYNHTIVNTTLKNFIFCNLTTGASKFFAPALTGYSCYNFTLVNCTFIGLEKVFSTSMPNLHLINCTFINSNGASYYTSISNKINLNPAQALIWCEENNTVEGCKFIGGEGSALIVLMDAANCNMVNNYFFINTTYAIITKYEYLNQLSIKNNYLVTNLNHNSFDIFTELKFDSINHSFSCDGEVKYGNDAIYIFDDTKVGSFSFGQYILGYNNTNYPLKTNITPSLEDSNLVFTLNTSDNGNLTLDDGTVVKVTDGRGSTPIAAAPGDTIQGTISGYLGEKYYALSSDYSLTVPKLSPNLNITVDGLEFEYNQPVEIAIELESQTANEANVSIYDKNGKLVDSKLTKGTAIFNNLAAGEYTVNVIYDEDDTFTNDSATATLTIIKATPELTLDVVNTTSTLEISINTGIDEDIVVNVNGDEYKLNKDNTTFTLTNQGEGKYYVTATYGGNENYTSVSKNKTVTLSKVDADLKVKAEVADNVVTITATLTPTTGTITYFVNNKQYTKAVGEELVVDDLTPGNYTVFASYAGDSMYDAANANDTFTISEKTKADPELKLSVEDSVITVSINSAATGDVIVTVGDISFVCDAGALAPIDVSKYLGNGTYSVSVRYVGDDNFTDASDSGSVTVPEEEVPVVELKDPNLKLDIKDTVVSVSIDSKATGDVIVTVGDISFVSDAQALAPVDVSKYLSNGTYSVSVKYVGDDNFTDASDSGSVTVPEEEVPVVELKDPGLKLDIKDTVVSVSIDSEATGDVIVTVGDISFVSDAQALAPIDVSKYLSNGTYSVSVKYVGDDNFTDAAQIGGSITIPDEEQPAQNETETVTPEMSVKVTNTTIEVTLPKDATGNVLVDVDGQGYYAPVKDGKASVNVIGLDAGTYPVTVNYLGDDKYANATKSTSITIPDEEQPVQNETEPVTPEMSVKVTNTTVDVTLPGDATGYVLADVNGQGYYAKVTNGKASIDIVGLDAGTYPVTVDYLGDDKYANATKTASVTIPDEEQPVQNETELVTPEMTVKVTNTTIEVTLPKDATGNVLVDVNGQGYYAPVKDGKASVNVIGLDAGTYPATVTYAGDDKYANATGSARVTVPKDEEPAQNETEPVDSNAKVDISEDAVNVELPKDATGYVLVDVDGKGYYAPVKDGKATLDLPELDEGEHTVSVTYTGDDKYKPATANKTITVENEIATVVASNLTKVEKASDRFEAVFTDSEGNALANRDVTFELRGTTYTRTTDANGKAGMNINLIPGTYSIKTTNPVTGESVTNTITVLTRLEGSDITKYFRNGTQYRVKVLDDNGNLAKAGEVVTFNINGVFYNRTTGADGFVQLSINLLPGDYIVTAQYKGCKISNIVKVLPVLTGKDLTKKFGQSGAYEATLLDAQGKPYANQEITLNINGVLYKRTTDANGVAKLNINLQAGKYIITASYNQAVTSNTITVTA